VHIYASSQLWDTVEHVHEETVMIDLDENKMVFLNFLKGSLWIMVDI